MAYKTCFHVMEHGAFCQSPALKNKEYCYFHAEFRARRLKMARARARGERWWLDLPCIEDMRSCQAAAARVFEASAAQLIDPAHAKVLFLGLRIMAGNFKSRQPWIHRQSDYYNDRSQPYVGAFPNFEAAHDLPEDIDLGDHPLEVFPMPEAEAEPEARNSSNASPDSVPSVPHPRDLSLGANVGSAECDSPATTDQGTANSEDLASSAKAKLADILRDAQTAIPGWRGMDVTADDIELWEIAEREGEKAAQIRAAELERNRRRRDRRVQRARYEELARNRNIQVAAQKLLADQKRAEATQAEAAEQQHAEAAQAQIAELQRAQETANPRELAEAREMARSAIEQMIANGLYTVEELTADKKPPASTAAQANECMREPAAQPASAGGAR